jgi:thymidylate synthase (FAD)
MKVILEPRVTIVAHTKFYPTDRFEIPEDGTDAEKLGSFAAKVCYDSSGKHGRSNTDNQTAILEHGHGSVLEHATVSFFIEGITRGLSLELNRHRPFAISQRSTRYTKEEDSAIVLEPYYADLFRKHKFARDSVRGWMPAKKVTDDELIPEVVLVKEYLDGAERAFKLYAEQVADLEMLNPNNLTGFDLRKWARGKARNILPHGLETRGTWTMNYRALRWFIEARSNRHAEPEIRQLADVLFTVVRPLAPTYFSDFKLNAVVDGISEWVPDNHKV